jgi:hypothetical protein
MTDQSTKFLDELITSIGEEAAIKLLEEAAKFRNVRSAYLQGDPDGVKALLNEIAGWEASDENNIFCRQLVPLLRELFVFIPAERAAAIHRPTDQKRATEFVTAVEVLRKLLNGAMGGELVSQTASHLIN